MKLYTPVQGTIKSLADDGAGILDVPGRTTKIKFAFPGDVVCATPNGRKKGETFAHLDSMTTPSADRVAARCPYFGSCGGCAWQALAYPKQVEAKRDLINESFSERKLPYRVETVTPAEDIFYYRNRMDFVFGQNGELGLKESGKWYSYLDLNECSLLSPESVEIMNRVRAWVKKHNLPPYSTKTEKGFQRYLVIREGKRTGERVVNLLTTSQFAMPDDFAATIGDLATHVLHGVNDSITDLSIADTCTVLKGSLDFHEEANGVRYTVPFGSFFQTNTAMAEKLFTAVADACKGAKEVLDLYCGVGFFALGLAKAGIKAHGVEIDPNAIRAATQSAVENHLTGVTFHSAKAEDVSWKESKADMVIVDPPRAGLHPRVIETLLEMAPQRILYVSCKHSRFAEELPKFLAKYRVTSLQAFDLFPHTPHVELVALLDKN